MQLVLGTLLRKNALLKRRAWRSSLCEFIMPLLFAALLASLDGVTDIVRISPGWSLENELTCPYPVPADGFEKTCTYPYSRFVRDTSTFGLLASNFRGLWSGHETAKIFLATSSGSQRERDALDAFVEWMEQEGTAEGPVEDFRELTFVLGDGSNAALEAYAASEDYGIPDFTEDRPEVALAIVFDEMDFDNLQFKYSLRLNSTQSATLFEVPRTTQGATQDTQRRLEWFGNDPNPEYAVSGFMTFQRMVDSWLIHAVGSTPTYDDVWQPWQQKFVPFPVQEYRWNELMFYVAPVLPLIYVLSFLYPASRIFEGLVRERETRVTEMLKVMGVSESWIVASWYATYAIFFGILATIITLASGTVLPSTSEAAGGFSPVIWAIFFLFGMGTTAFCFATSTVFWRSRTASFVGTILYLIAFFMSYAISTPEVDPKPGFMLLFPQVAFALTVQTLASLEANSVGATSTTLSERLSGFSINEGLNYMIAGIIVWTLLGAYLSNVVPREYGQRRSVFFPFKPSYWRQWGEFLRDTVAELRGRAARDGSSGPIAAAGGIGPLPKSENVEERPRNDTRRPGIQIRHLRKEFATPSGTKVAVDDLSMDLFDGEILALLGHNGAGKTTTMMMLSGVYPSTSGDAFVRGASINTEINRVRRSLGYCFQHDVLYPTLSVYSHLWFYGRLKGLRGAALSEAIDRSIADVGLTEKRHVPTRALSGGMKRKLSVAIALLGGSKVVFVDEPTSGVDPYSRRSIWQVLQNARAGRVIVLSTHFLEEADILGDRVAIMAEGKLQCLGSSLFLKRRFGAGYVLTMVKKASGSHADDEANVKRIARLVRKHVPAARLSSNVGTEVAFQLPTAAVGEFAGLFRALDDSNLPIDQYGVSVTTLEDVFLEVARADDQKRRGAAAAGAALATPTEPSSGNSSSGGDAEEKRVAVAPLAEDDGDGDFGGDLADDDDEEDAANEHLRNTALLRPTFARHLGALFLKRFLYARRDFKAFCCSVLMPVVLFAAGLTVLTLVPVGNNDPAYRFGPEDWNPTIGGFVDPIPFVELAENGTEVRRLTGDPALFSFPQFEPRPQPLREYPAGQNVTIFGREYGPDGLPTADTCRGVNCAANPNPLQSTALLNLAEDMLGVGPQATALPRLDRGASLYAAAVVQPTRAVLPFGCLIAGFEFSESSLVLNYQQQECTERASPCALLEAEFQGARVCLPVGCLSNIIEQESLGQIVEQQLGTGSSGLSPEEEQEQLEFFLATSFVLTCESGALCNTGPSNLFEPSVCRGDGGQCIAEGLTPYRINFTGSELGLFPAPPADYEICGEGGGGGGGPSLSTPAPTRSPVSQAACFESGIPEFLQSTVLNALVNLSATNFTVESSVDLSNSSSVECFDTGFDCSFALLPGLNGTTTCVFDSCLADRNASLDAIEALLPGTTLTINNASRANCSEAALLCDASVDLAQLGSIADIEIQLNASGINATIFDLFNVTLNATQFADIANFNLTSFLEDPNNGLIIGTVLADLAGGGFNATTLLQTVTAALGVTLPDLNGTDPLSQPGVAEALANAAQQIFEVENELVLCADPADTCLLAEVELLGGSLCIPVGCAAEFAPVNYPYVPLLGGVASFEQVPVFECVEPACNEGCRRGGNCEAEDLEPLLYNASSQEFVNGSLTWCPPPPIRFGYTALINSTTRHGAPVVANAVSNALLRLKLREAPPTDRVYSAAVLAGARIETQSLPLPLPASIRTIISGFLALTAALFAIIAFAFVPAQVASYVVQEREATSNIKLSQLVSGAGVVPYWLSFYLFDLLNFMIPLVLTLLLLVAFDIRTFLDNGVLSAIAVLLFAYGCSIIPFAYLLSNAFSEHTSALIGLLFSTLISGLILVIASYVMEQLDNQAVNDVNAQLKDVYRLFPAYCLGDSLIQLAILKVLEGFVGPGFDLPSPYDWDIAGASITYMFVEAVVLMLAVLFVEVLRAYPRLQQALPNPNWLRAARRAWLRRRNGGTLGPRLSQRRKTRTEEEDEDVFAERRRVLAGEADKDTILLRNLTKRYGSGKLAVSGLTLGISDGEAFGLLGINGAGKTTTLKMLTGELAASEGFASIGGHSVALQLREARRLIGYCPQFDALLELLTVREHLELFGRIKGLYGAALNYNVRRLLRRLTLTPFEHKLAKGLSGGTKRKLSLGVALIGNPRVLFLDECTTGVDPVSKRFLWNVLDDVRDGRVTGRKTTVVLTSHSMEEVEALSTRIGILVGGQFRCLGSSQHLKGRFGKGLLVEATLAPPDAADVEALCREHSLPDLIFDADLRGSAVASMDGDAGRVQLILDQDDSAWALCSQMQTEGAVAAESLVEWWLLEQAFERVSDFLGEQFPGAALVERHDTQMRFSLPVKRIADVFEALETHKQELGLTDYAVSQVSLEQIFNVFASAQEEERGRARGIVNLGGLEQKSKRASL